MQERLGRSVSRKPGKADNTCGWAGAIQEVRTGLGQRDAATTCRSVLVGDNWETELTC